MSKQRNTLSKQEKLKSLKLIELIFAERKSIKAYPFVVTYKRIDRRDSSVLFGISVSKKNFKKAVERNRVKRLAREAYRTQKELILDLENKDYTVAAMFIYIGKKMPDFDDVKKGMKKAMYRLNEANK